MSEPTWDDADAATLDRTLTAVFADARPGPDLEDRLVRRLRAADIVPARPPARWRRGLALGAGATAALAATAAGVAVVVNAGGVPFPGQMFAEPVAERVVREGLDTATRGAGVLSDVREDVAGVPMTAFDRSGDRVFGRPPSGGGGFGGQGGGGFGGGGFGGGVQGAVAQPSPVTPGTEVMTSYMGNMWWDKDGQEAKPADGSPVLFARSSGGVPGAPGFTFNTTNGTAPAAKAPKAAPDANHLYFLPALTAEPIDEAGKARTRTSTRGLATENEVRAKAESEVKRLKAVDAKLDQLQLQPDKDAKPGDALRRWGNGKAGEAVALGEPAVQLGLQVDLAGKLVPRQPVVNNIPAAADPAAARKVVIRSGDIEFEIDSFDSAVAAVTQLVTAIPNAYVATVNSEKLPNGKVRGSVAVRVPPDKLDGLVLDLRKELGKAGELKGQRIGSQDITKQFTDLESRLRAARTMETRLLEIIKTGKGEIKTLLEAEKELGVWRTKIEEIEGELRYFGNLASLSSLTIILAEKEIRAAAGETVSERVQLGVETEDVEQALRDALKAVLEAKGRVTKSELKKHAAGQFAATLHFETPPDAGGPVLDRFKQLGRIARQESNTVRSVQGTPSKDTKVTRGDTEFQVQLYNLANIAPRETATLQVAAVDVPAAYRTVREAIERAKGRVLSAQLTEGEPKVVTAVLDAEVRRADEPAVLAALAAAGEVLSRAVSRAAETETTTDTKVRLTATIGSAARLKPRETTSLGLEVESVDVASGAFAAAVSEAGGRVVEAGINKEASGRVSGRFVYEVPLSSAGGVLERVKAAGNVRVLQTARDPSAPDGRLAVARLEVTAATGDLIVNRDDGVWPQVRKGLSVSATALLASLSWLIVAVCVVLPWAVVLWGGYRLVRRRRA